MRETGFIGAGNIGRHMILRLRERGHVVTVCDVSEATRADFAAQGFATVANPEALGGLNHVIVMVGNDAQAEAALFGPRGLAAGIDPDHAPVLLLMSTLLPATVRDIAARLSHLCLLDAPVSGGLVKAREGALAIMAGGSEANFVQARPLLADMGQEIFHGGPIGAGATAKLINNMLGIGNLYLAAEACALAMANGTDLAKILPIIESSTGRNFWLQSIGETVAHYAAFTTPPEAFHSLVQIVSKDLELIRALQDGAGLALPMLNGVATGVAEMHDSATAAQVLMQWQAIGALRA